MTVIDRALLTELANGDKPDFHPQGCLLFRFIVSLNDDDSKPSLEG